MCLHLRSCVAPAAEGPEKGVASGCACCGGGGGGAFGLLLNRENMATTAQVRRLCDAQRMFAVVLLHEWLPLPLAEGCWPRTSCWSGICCCCCCGGGALLLLRLCGISPWGSSQPAVCRSVLRKCLGCLLQDCLPEAPANCTLRTSSAALLQRGAAWTAPGFAQTVCAGHAAGSDTASCKLSWNALERHDLALGGLVVPERGACGAAKERVRIPALVYKPADIMQACEAFGPHSLG